jgi:diguanylate cyclase (GGDEF)-like protein
VQDRRFFLQHIHAFLDLIPASGLGLWALSGGSLRVDQKTAAVIGLENNVLEFKDFLELVDRKDRRKITTGVENLLAHPDKEGCAGFRIYSRKSAGRHVRAAGKSCAGPGGPVILGTAQFTRRSPLNARLDAVVRELSRKQQLYNSISQVADILLNAEDSVFQEDFKTCLEITGRAAGLVRVYMYKNHLVEGILCCTQIYEWAEGVTPALGEDFTTDMPYHVWPGLKDILEGGRNYNRLAKTLPREIRAMIPGESQAVLFVPIFLKNLLWGFVGYERALEEKLFDADEESVLGSTALLLANAVINFDLSKNLYKAVDKINTTAIKAEEMEKAASTDALTGLYNRRHFMDLSLGIMEKSRRFNTPCYAMILDLDFFKKVNDTCGHLAGDEVLRKVAVVMKNALRSYDLLARYGGEEFVVLVSDTSRENVMNLAERIREAIANTPCVYHCIKIPCTVSIGVAESFPDCTITSLIDRADRGLYIAKETGRNRVILCED